MSNAPDTDTNSLAKKSELKKRINILLKGQIIQEVSILNNQEIVVFFKSGDRLFVDAESDLNISVT